MATSSICTIRGAVIEVGNPPERFRLEAAAFDIDQGDKVAIVSPSGSGKSLLLEFMGLIRRPEHLESFLLKTRDGRTANIADLWMRGAARSLTVIRRMGVGFLLQSGGLLPFLSVAENVALPARIAGRGRENGPALLEQLGLADVVNRRPSELSVGQRQRAALARAISTQPTLLLADEPTAALDSRNADTVMALIGAQISTGQIGAAVIATHDEGRARAYGFRTLSFDVGARPEGGLARLQSTRLAV